MSIAADNSRPCAKAAAIVILIAGSSRCGTAACLSNAVPALNDNAAGSKAASDSSGNRPVARSA